MSPLSVYDAAMASRILIVDDETRIRTLLKQCLQDLTDDGLILDEAANGNDAVTLYQEHHPPLVILDVMMPGMNGFEVCELIKADTQHPTYVLMLTARGQHFDRAYGQKVGVDRYITKPFDPDEVEAIVREALASSSGV